DGGNASAPGGGVEATEVSTAPAPATGGEGTEPTATATPYPVLSAIDTEESDTARLVIDGDPSTVWQVHPDQSPDQVRLRLDLGDVVAIDRITWDVSDPTVLPPFEVWLSTDDVTWWNAAQVDTSTVQAGQTYATPLGYWARYVKLVIPDVEQTGLSEVGGLGELAVWPATDARDLTELGSPVTPEPMATAPAAVDSSDMLPTPEPVPTDEPIVAAPEILPTEAPTEQTNEAPAVPTPEPGDETNGG
ncbi:MAG TPA: discoidin domain-containing protein, partial [Thermomicrobiales bacterium]|nr:discoidin domain-containing protein [Thermomicrobiales bacterium]